MTVPTERDRQVEQLLRQALESDRLADSACVDAEQLAAWAEGGLGRQEASVVEQHLADCPHCQAMVAAFVDSAPPEIPRASLWQRWAWRGLLPAAAASVVVLAWALASRPLPTAGPPVAVTERAEPSRETPADAPVQPPVAPAASPAPPRRASAGDGPGESASAAKVPAPREAQPLGLRQPANAFSGSPALSRQIAAAESADSRSPESGRTRSPMASSEAAAVVPASPQPATASGSAREEASAMAGEALADVAAPVPVHARAGRVPALFAAPASAGRWRIDPDGGFWRSEDGGRTWAVVGLTPASRIAAGSAPAAAVCWIAGDAGAVWLARDGAEFVRRPFPENVSLVGIVATNAAQAAVTAADGRVFTTNDGGASWQTVRANVP